MDKMLNLYLGILGATVSYFFGGWSALLDALLLFVIIDYVSGVIAAGKDGQLSSRVGLIGIAKKVFIFFLVAIAHKIDVTLGGQTHFFRDSTIFFYLSNELLSIIENGGRIGLPIPEPITRAVKVLKGRGGQSGNA
jgi:toxin secretion/phage lysis holin